ncbi:hypothetical protein EIL87_18270 [Saccharopolyspora rhizosphaerae]|uniref:Uncharacterized protein n=1 Tax=Saccharopolyspora rhizosphaerae TaxID=2492662 RepID=A0A426JNN6_9PSEU|nr:hypothetical protein [Saccharopolyspora rhizosphaerae]RRO14695.1 hypothetical protein EIL87_18270 [Saccharopolyspora rhizosphaerae]
MTRQHGVGKLLVLPLLVLGFLLVPFALLPAHGLPGHAESMSASHSTTSHHGAAPEHSHAGEAQSSASFTDEASASSHDHGFEDGAPHCDAGPDFSAAVLTRTLNSSDDLDHLLLALVLTATTVALLPRQAAWASRLRHWLSQPPWRPTGTAFLHFACVART